MSDDAALLRRYAEERSEPAFTELVRRHLPLVYGAALRRCGDPHRAEDVAQRVFTALARQARSLAHHTVLTAWFYSTTRNIAVDQIRAEQNRQAREQEAHLMHQLLVTAPPEVDWARLRLVLDEAMDELPDPDRSAVLLRFFQQRPFAEIGAALRLSEDAARMRVDRALDKLHALLARRGLTSTTAALATVLANQTAATVPAGLAASIVGSAMSGVAAVAGAGSLAAVVYFMSASKITLSVAAAGTLALGLAVFQSSQARTASTELARIRSDRAALAARVAGLEKSVTVAEQEQADREAALERARSAKADNLAASARRAAAAEEKAQQDKALQQFLANDPELRKLRFEYHRAGAK